MEREALVTLSLWALNPALAFNDLAGRALHSSPFFI